MSDTDVVIAGGGPTGLSAAAALAGMGFSVTLVEPGLDRARMLVGELLHPAAVEDLCALGFGKALKTIEGAQRVRGFAAIDNRAAHRLTSLLPYNVGDLGLSLEHAELVDAMTEHVATLPGVTTIRARVKEVPVNDENGVTVKLSDGRELRARLLVGADGRSSQVRKLVGIEETHQRISTMVGVLVPAELLPYAEYGHLFVGGPAPVLAYAITATHARVLIDLPLSSTAATLEEQHETLLSGLPAPLARGVVDALAERGNARLAANDQRLAARMTKASCVLVGDAAACCHPVSASGISSATRDVRVLAAKLPLPAQRGEGWGEGRRAATRPSPGLAGRPLPASQGEVSRALAGYVRERRAAHRTRLSLASALYQAFVDQSETMAALRAGLFRYWHESGDGGARSMSLLSMREARMRRMAREYTRVVTHGVTVLANTALDDVRDGHTRRAFTRARAGVGLIASAVPLARGAVAGALEQFASRFSVRPFP